MQTNRRQYTEREKKVLLELASQCVWSDPTKKPTPKMKWYTRPTNLMLIAIWLIELIGLIVSSMHGGLFWEFVAVHGIFACLCLTAYIKRDKLGT